MQNFKTQPKHPGRLGAGLLSCAVVREMAREMAREMTRGSARGTARRTARGVARGVARGLTLTALTTLTALGMASGAAQAQVITEERQGLRENTPRWHALTDVTLVAAPGRVIPQATVVLRDGVITAAGVGVAVPAGARVWSLPGRRVYAGFIDAASGFGVPEALRAAPPGRPMFGPGSELPATAAPRGEGGTLVARSTAARNTVLRAE